MARLYVKRGRANPLWQGHPWLYSGAIEREEGSYEPGDVVEVCDAQGRPIGRGFVNPRSQIRVRLITRRDEAVDDALIARRLGEASSLRQRLGLPSPATDAFRWVNAEGDGLPGLIVDRYRDVAAVQFTALGMKRLEALVFDALAQAPGIRSVVEVAAGGFADLEGFASATRTVRGEAVDEVAYRENDLELRTEPLRGQKTGAFLDQRENRRRVGELARGSRVLDLYAYHGGFALAALRGGAASAVCVDASARAVERIREHAAANQLAPLEAHEADVFRFLEQTTPRAFDLVIVDPPKFARARKDLDAALKGYQRLNSLAMNACAEGALLATCSCSGNVDSETFERVIASAAQASNRRVQILETGSQAADHPLLPAFSEGRYLKFLLCRVL